MAECTDGGEDAVIESPTTTAEGSQEQPPKRGRGRPRKVAAAQEGEQPGNVGKHAEAVLFWERAGSGLGADSQVLVARPGWLMERHRTQPGTWNLKILTMAGIQNRLGVAYSEAPAERHWTYPD